MNSTTRFTDRVDDYVKYRPAYPGQVFEALAARLPPPASVTVADIGAGTGISAKPLLEMGFTVYAVEPNAAMRAAAERQLSGFGRFHSVAGTAEVTTLPDRSVDAVLAAQAFHWFDVGKTKAEFRRILKSGGWVGLLWNDRDEAGSEFAVAYEGLLQEFGTDYDRVKASGLRAIDRNRLADFFGPTDYELLTFANHQDLDFEALRGRVLSASYIPKPPNLRYPQLAEELAGIFSRHAAGGRVRINYTTRLYLGRL